MKAQITIAIVDGNTKIQKTIRKSGNMSNKMAETLDAMSGRAVSAVLSEYITKSNTAD